MLKELKKKAALKRAPAFGEYATDGFYDELFLENGRPRPEAKLLVKNLNDLSRAEITRRQSAAALNLFQRGVTFTLSGKDNAQQERIMPLDIIPRIVKAGEWKALEKGLKQRVQALNLFLTDVYNDKRILKEKIIPESLVLSGSGYLKECEGLKPPGGIWTHISGIDLVRHSDGQYYVLEDNVRCPSGVSYVLENRLVMKRMFPSIFQNCRILPVDEYPLKLFAALQHAGGKQDKPAVVVLTPGIYNSAYFEHSFLAQQMGVELVEGRDLVVSDDTVFMKSTDGLRKVDVIYRRIDDVALDPLVFNNDSLLGVPGLMSAYRAGNVVIANAPGTGISDDKLIYSYVPEMIRFYLSEEPLLNNVPTFKCALDQDRDYVLENLANLFVKMTNGAGGYGMLVGPASTKEERSVFAAAIKKNPRQYIAQPPLALSRVPTIVKDGIEGRHVDLRPYVVYGKDIFVLPGGLTRVALRKGSLVVNSSQGGGSKDTWVFSEDLC